MNFSNLIFDAAFSASWQLAVQRQWEPHQEEGKAWEWKWRVRVVRKLGWSWELGNARLTPQVMTKRRAARR